MDLAQLRYQINQVRCQLDREHEKLARFRVDRDKLQYSLDRIKMMLARFQENQSIRSKRLAKILQVKSAGIMTEQIYRDLQNEYFGSSSQMAELRIHDARQEVEIKINQTQERIVVTRHNIEQLERELSRLRQQLAAQIAADSAK